MLTIYMCIKAAYPSVSFKAFRGDNAIGVSDVKAVLSLPGWSRPTPAWSLLLRGEVPPWTGVSSRPWLCDLQRWRSCEAFLLVKVSNFRLNCCYITDVPSLHVGSILIRENYFRRHTCPALKKYQPKSVIIVPDEAFNRRVYKLGETLL